MQAKVEVSSVVRKILHDGGYTHGQLAFFLGVNEDRITSLATGKVKKFHPDEVLALVEKIQVRPEFLKTGDGDVFEAEKRAFEVPQPPLDWRPGDPVGSDINEKHKNTSLKQKLSEDFVVVPRYDVEACAGYGAVINSEQIVDYLAFRSTWVRSLGLSPNNMALIEVRGDSMEPTLSNGDLVLLNTRCISVQENAIYVIKNDGVLRIKRIQVRMDGSAVIKSDNPRYEPEEIDSLTAENLDVVGLVVWSGRRM